MELYRVIVSDPPWSFTDPLPGKGRGAIKHYQCMSPEEICGYLPALEAGGLEIATDAVLFLWRVSSQVALAYRVIESWGFREKSEIIWHKRTRTGRQHFGMGRSVRAAHETCIIATRGKPQRLSASVRSVFDARVGRHSEKPDAFYRLVERLYEGPYLELFARRAQPGWSAMGIELDAQKVA